MKYEVSELTDDAEILPLLTPDPRWSAYALCDLDPPYRRKTRILGARAAGETRALLVLYTLPGTTAVLPYGDADGIRAIVNSYDDLPQSIFMVTLEEHLPALEARYAPGSTTSLWRMVVEGSEFRDAGGEGSHVESLGSRDGAAIEDLYHGWTGKVFDGCTLATEVYRGVYAGDRLIAIAGTHAISQARSIAAIGGVFTHPDHRGRGLATATTAAVARELVARGIELLVLNVRQDNHPAIAVYHRLGFREWLPFIDGTATKSWVPGGRSQTVP